MVDAVDESVARGRGGVDLDEVPGELRFQLCHLPLGVLEIERQIGDQRLELRTTRRSPWARGGEPPAIAAVPGLDGPELQDFVDVDQLVLEGHAGDRHPVLVANRAHPRRPLVGDVLVEPDGQERKELTGMQAQLGVARERHAALRDIDEGAGRAVAGLADLHCDRQGSQLGRAVTMRPEEDLAALGAVELFVLANAMQWSGHVVPSVAGIRRTSNRAPPCGRSRTAISPWWESMIS